MGRGKDRRGGGGEKAEIVRKKNSEILGSLRFSSKGALCGHACVHTCVREVEEAGGWVGSSFFLILARCHIVTKTFLHRIWLKGNRKKKKNLREVNGC